jgi:hypothetical protein
MLRLLGIFSVILAFVRHVESVSTLPFKFRRARENFTLQHNLTLGSDLLPFEEDSLLLHNHSVDLLPFEEDSLLQNHSAFRQLPQVRRGTSLTIFMNMLLVESSGVEEWAKTAQMMAVCLFIFLIIGLIWLFLSQDEGTSTESTTNSPTRNLSEDEALKLSENAWPRAYLLANEEEKKALELLLLCRIIQPDEFANGDVSDQHVEECMWIAKQMLRQKDYVFWTRNPVEAAKAFDESVTSRFPERTVVRSATSTSGMVTPEFAVTYARSDIGVVDCRSKDLSPGEPVSPFAPLQKPRVSEAAARIQKVQVRCQELATGGADLTPRCMIRALQGMPPPPPTYERHWTETHSMPRSQETVVTLTSPTFASREPQ